VCLLFEFLLIVKLETASMEEYGELPSNEPKGRVQMWNWDSGIQSGATTAAPSISGHSQHHEQGTYPDTNQVLGDWQREFTMEEANRK